MTTNAAKAASVMWHFSQVNPADALDIYKEIDGGMSLEFIRELYGVEPWEPFESWDWAEFYTSVFGMAKLIDRMQEEYK
jgi:hypothetical protein